LQGTVTDFTVLKTVAVLLLGSNLMHKALISHCHGKKWNVWCYSL